MHSCEVNKCYRDSDTKGKWILQFSALGQHYQHKFDTQIEAEFYIRTHDLPSTYELRQVSK